jgi:putative membrane protein
MRIGVFIAAVLGLAVAVYVVLHIGIDQVVSAVSRVGFSGYALVVLTSVALPFVLGLAWFTLVADSAPISRYPVFALARQIRDSASDVLPFSQIGGVVIGIRAIILRGLPPPIAFASGIADITTELMAQLAFIAVGTALCVAQLQASASTAPYFKAIILGLGLMIPGMAAFIFLQHRGSSFAMSLAKRWLPNAVQHAQAFNDAIRAIYRAPARVALSATIHLVGWIVSGIVTYVAIRTLGARIDLLSAIAIESLLGALRSATAFVPASIGVQEVGYATLTPLFGLGPEIGLAVSLIRRARDITIAVPVLLTWQAMEGHRAFARIDNPLAEP